MMAAMMLVVMEMRVMKMVLAITVRINLHVLNDCCNEVEDGDLHKYFTLHDIV